MPLQNLEHAAWMLQGPVGVPGLDRRALNSAGFAFAFARGRRGIDVFVHPAPASISAAVRIPSAEQAVQIFRSLNLVGDDRRRVGVIHDVLFEVRRRFYNIAKNPTEKSDIGAGADRNVDVGGGAG